MMKLNSKRSDKATHTIKKALSWLENAQKPEGGFISGMNSGLFSFFHPFIYSEITGYALKFFINLYKENKASKAKSSIDLAANFLINMQTDEGPFLHGTTLNGKKRDVAYTFDTAICTSALIDLTNFLGDEKYISSIKKSIDWLINNAIFNDTFYTLYDATNKKFIENNYFWGEESIFQFKNIICLLKAEKLLGALDADYVKMLSSLVDRQNSDGSFPVRSNDTIVFSHGHCYATESLLFAYYFLKKNIFLQTTIKAADWLVNVQDEDGAIPNLHGKISGWDRIRNSFPPFNMQATDATAQALRVWIALSSLGYEKYQKSIIRAIDYILKVQCNKGKLDGAFYHYKKGSYKIPAVRTWSTLFATHSLLLYNNYDNNFDNILGELF